MQDRGILIIYVGVTAAFARTMDEVAGDVWGGPNSIDVLEIIAPEIVEGSNWPLRSFNLLQDHVIRSRVVVVVYGSDFGEHLYEPALVRSFRDFERSLWLMTRDHDIRVLPVLVDYSFTRRPPFELPFELQSEHVRDDSLEDIYRVCRRAMEMGEPLYVGAPPGDPAPAGIPSGLGDGGSVSDRAADAQEKVKWPLKLRWYFRAIVDAAREAFARPEPVSPEAEEGDGRPDEVVSSVYAPRIAAPGDEVLVQVYSYKPGDEVAVREMAARADAAAPQRGAQALSEPVARGTELGFHFRMRGAEVEEPDVVLVWNGDTLTASFAVYFPEDSPPRSAVGTVLVTRDGTPIGTIRFALEVVTREEKRRSEQVSQLLGTLSRFREAFVSHASEDREKVLPRVQALKAANINIFQDIVDLKPGERWERKLYERIGGCDAFFLFWSSAARASAWVRKEALYAYERQGGREGAPPEIIPIIIEGPPPVDPPEELKFLHFNDNFIYLMKGVEAEAEARRRDRRGRRPATHSPRTRPR